MLIRIIFLLAYLSVGAIAAVKDEQLKSFIKLTFSVSKATYLPFKGRRLLQNGQIMENPSYTGSNDIPENDRASCIIGGWTANIYNINETEVAMFTNVKQRLVVFGFRGTDNGEDWGKNLDVRIVKETIGTDSFTIHKGFLDRYKFISKWFENKYSQVPSDYIILLTGHSLGGAEATIAAVYASSKLNRKPDGVVTYGSPKVGTREFKHYYQHKVGCGRTIRMTVRFDPAPSFPVHILWYTHVCPNLQVLGKITANLLYKHSLYGGYEDGIKRKYQDDMEGISLGCDKIFNV